MKVRLLLSLLIIGFVSTMAFAATKAALQTQVTLAANTFSTGTVDLQISKSTSSSPTTFTDISIAGFTGSFLPGQTTTETVWLKNTSSTADLSISAQAVNVSGEISPANVTIAFTPVSNDGTSNVGTAVSHTLADWETAASLGTTIAHASGKQRFKMDVTLSNSVTTAGSSNFDMVFTGEPAVSPTSTPTLSPTP